MTCAKCTELVTQLSQAVAAQEKMAVRESELENEVEYWHKLWQRASLALLDKVDTATTERIAELEELKRGYAEAAVFQSNENTRLRKALEEIRNSQEPWEEQRTIAIAALETRQEGQPK